MLYFLECQMRVECALRLFKPHIPSSWLAPVVTGGLPGVGLIRHCDRGRAVESATILGAIGTDFGGARRGRREAAVRRRPAAFQAESPPPPPPIPLSRTSYARVPPPNLLSR